MSSQSQSCSAIIIHNHYHLGSHHRPRRLARWRSTGAWEHFSVVQDSRIVELGVGLRNLPVVVLLRQIKLIEAVERYGLTVVVPAEPNSLAAVDGV